MNNLNWKIYLGIGAAIYLYGRYKSNSDTVMGEINNIADDAAVIAIIGAAMLLL